MDYLSVIVALAMETINCGVNHLPNAAAATGVMGIIAVYR